MGVHLIQHKWGITRLRTGVVINQEFNLEGIRNNSLYEWPITVDVTLFKLKTVKIRFNTTQTLFVGLTQSGRYRNDGDTRLSWTVVNNLDIGLNFYNDYDNQPPVEIGGNFDYGMVISIGYTLWSTTPPTYLTTTKNRLITSSIPNLPLRYRTTTG
jgi:hypothetical protein